MPESDVGVERLVAFGRRLRGEGLAVGTGRINDFCRAAALLPPEDLYWAGRGTLVARKTGTFAGTANDVGVIGLPEGGELVVAFYTKASQRDLSRTRAHSCRDGKGSVRLGDCAGVERASRLAMPAITPACPGERRHDCRRGKLKLALRARLLYASPKNLKEAIAWRNHR